MKTTGTPSTDPNHMDSQLGTRFGTSFVLDNVIDGVIAFANGDVQPPPHLYVVETTDDGTELFLGNHPETREVVKVPRDFAQSQFSEQVGDDRSRAIEILDIAAQGMIPLSEFLRTIVDIDEAANIAIYPILTFDKSGGAVLGWRVSGPAARKGWAMAAALLITEGARGDLTEVGRCGLESCGRFFRIRRKGPGKPSRKYCPGTDHMERAHALASTARSRTKRRKDAAERRKKGRITTVRKK